MKQHNIHSYHLNGRMKIDMIPVYGTYGMGHTYAQLNLKRVDNNHPYNIHCRVYGKREAAYQEAPLLHTPQGQAYLITNAPY